MNVLVVGGAGYIGSHMVACLAQHGADITVFDNLSAGHRDAVLAGKLVVGDLADTLALRELFATQRFDVVMHFASFIQVGESVADPARYYRNNVGNTLNLLEAMCQAEVKRFVFSSTAAIFGEPQAERIDESHPQRPINPYGWSKLMVERMLADFDRAYGLKSVCLRYFNAAGADPYGRLGERHEPETHLIPLVLRAAAGRRAALTVNGTDYPTVDGTCVRDYIHVADLSEAHWLAIQHLLAGNGSAQFNLGNGQGFSIRQVIEAVERVTGRQVPLEYGPRRAGDPPVLVADSARAKAQLGWQPQFAELETIISHAWQWESRPAH